VFKDGGACRVHGGPSKGAYTNNGRAAGVFERALKDLEPEYPEFYDSFKTAQKSKLSAIREECVQMQAAWIAQALRTLAIPKTHFQRVRQMLVVMVERGDISETTRRLIANRCYGPEAKDLAAMSRAMFSGIKDTEDPWQMFAVGLIKLVFSRENIEDVRDVISQRVIDDDVREMIEDAHAVSEIDTTGQREQ
jgi:hypothetical protein